MSRLASFQGPSTPSKIPVNPQEQASPSPSSKGKRSNKSRQHVKPMLTATSPEPSSPSRKKALSASPIPITSNSTANLSSNDYSFTETTVHRRLRQTLLEIRSAARRWDELTKVDGFKSAKEIVDSRTLIENALVIVPKGQLPAKVVIGPHIRAINDGIRRLKSMISNLKSLLNRINSLVESLDALHIQALNELHLLSPSAPSPSVDPLDPDVPLWPISTWSLSRFCAIVPALLLPYYHRSLLWHQSMVGRLCSSQPPISWEQARSTLGVWKDGNYWTEAEGRDRLVHHDGIVLESGWSADWEGICAVEIMDWK